MPELLLRPSARLSGSHLGCSCEDFRGRASCRPALRSRTSTHAQLRDSTIRLLRWNGFDELAAFAEDVSADPDQLVMYALLKIEKAKAEQAATESAAHIARQKAEMREEALKYKLSYSNTSNLRLRQNVSVCGVFEAIEYKHRLRLLARMPQLPEGKFRRRHIWEGILSDNDISECMQIKLGIGSNLELAEIAEDIYNKSSAAANAGLLPRHADVVLLIEEVLSRRDISFLECIFEEVHPVEFRIVTQNSFSWRLWRCTAGDAQASASSDADEATGG